MTTTTAQFSLHDLIRLELDASTSPDPGVIAHAVVGQIPDEHLREALTQTLRATVREVIRSTRIENPPPQMRPPNRSAKVAAIREMWRHHLRERYSVAGSWTFLGDMTYDDLMTAAEERMDLAKKNEAQADRLRHYASLIVQHQVSAFGQLPPAVLQAALA
jgi:hypothetical protein